MRRALAAGALFVGMFIARGAWAHPCGDGDPCPKGFWCESNVCVSNVCHDDSACGAGFRCDKGALCKPQWQLACEVDADCGIGFQCLPTLLECDCSSDGYVPADAAITPISCALPVVTTCESAKDCPTAECDGGAGPCTCWTDYFCHETTAASHPCAAATDCLSGWRCGCPSSASGDVDSGCAPSCQPPNDDFNVKPVLFNDDPLPTQPTFGGDMSDAGDASLAGDNSAADTLPATRHACSVGRGSPEQGSPALRWAWVASIAFGVARRRRRPPQASGE